MRLTSDPAPGSRSAALQRGTLRGPQARRSPDAPVTLRGWLDKQGSERLRLWKTRWFVLSEYCLYYYKGRCASRAGLAQKWCGDLRAFLTEK